MGEAEEILFVGGLSRNAYGWNGVKNSLPQEISEKLRRDPGPDSHSIPKGLSLSWRKVIQTMYRKVGRTFGHRCLIPLSVLEKKDRRLWEVEDGRWAVAVQPLMFQGDNIPDQAKKVSTVHWLLRDLTRSASGKVDFEMPFYESDLVGQPDFEHADFQGRFFPAKNWKFLGKMEFSMKEEDLPFGRKSKICFHFGIGFRIENMDLRFELFEKPTEQAGKEAENLSVFADGSLTELLHKDDPFNYVEPGNQNITYIGREQFSRLPDLSKDGPLQYVRGQSVFESVVIGSASANLPASGANSDMSMGPPPRRPMEQPTVLWQKFQAVHARAVKEGLAVYLDLERRCDSYSPGNLGFLERMEGLTLVLNKSKAPTGAMEAMKICVSCSSPKGYLSCSGMPCIKCTRAKSPCVYGIKHCKFLVVYGQTDIAAAKSVNTTYIQSLFPGMQLDDKLLRFLHLYLPGIAPTDESPIPCNVGEKANAIVYSPDIRSLFPHMKLNDGIINLWLRYQKHYRQKDVHIYDPTFYKKLKQHIKNGKSIGDVPPNKKHIIIPVHDPELLHWYSVIVVNTSSALTIITLDSLALDHSETYAHLKLFFEATRMGSSVVLGENAINISLQDNIIDCGIWVLIILEEFLKAPDEFVDLVGQKRIIAELKGQSTLNKRYTILKFLESLSGQQMKEVPKSF